MQAHQNINQVMERDIVAEYVWQMHNRSPNDNTCIEDSIAKALRTEPDKVKTFISTVLKEAMRRVNVHDAMLPSCSREQLEHITQIIGKEILNPSHIKIDNLSTRKIIEKIAEHPYNEATARALNVSTYQFDQFLKQYLKPAFIALGIECERLIKLSDIIANYDIEKIIRIIDHDLERETQTNKTDSKWFVWKKKIQGLKKANKAIVPVASKSDVKFFGAYSEEKQENINIIASNTETNESWRPWDNNKINTTLASEEEQQLDTSEQYHLKNELFLHNPQNASEVDAAEDDFFESFMDTVINAPDYLGLFDKTNTGGQTIEQQESGVFPPQTPETPSVQIQPANEPDNRKRKLSPTIFGCPQAEEQEIDHPTLQNEITAKRQKI